MSFHTILVPVDGESPSDAAVWYALSMAEEEQASLIFCHAQVPVPGYLLDEPLPAGMKIDSQEAVAWWSRHVLDRARGRAAQLGFDAQVRSLRGDPVAGILETARAEGADLIVMGTHGRHGPARALLGSTTEGVLRRSNLPVLVLPCATPECLSRHVDARDPGALA
ncbi:universal stress protein [bacterium]|nr:MAG: universal stress protein [bacterium]